MKLCVISHSYVEQANLPILASMAAQPGVELALITPDRYNIDLQHSNGLFQPTDAGYKVYRVPIRFGQRQGSFIYHLEDLNAALDDFRPDILLHEQEVFALGALQVARVAHRRGLPLVMQVAENLHRKLILPRRRIRRFVLAYCAGLMCWSQGAAKVHRDWGFRAAVAVVPGMAVATMQESPRFGTRGGEVFEVCFAGSLIAGKGVACLLRAVALLRDQGVAVRCSIAGHGPERPRLEAQVKELRLGGQVRFLGVLPQTEVLALLGQSDVLVLASRRMKTWEEQFGRVLVQAMSEATVTVGTRTGAIPEVIGSDDLLFDEEDSAGLAAILARLAGDDVELERTQRQLWQRAEKLYRNEVLAGLKMEFLRSVLESHATPQKP